MNFNETVLARENLYGIKIRARHRLTLRIDLDYFLKALRAVTIIEKVILSVASIPLVSASDVYPESMVMDDHVTPKVLYLKHIRYFSTVFFKGP